MGFNQTGDRFDRKVPVRDINTANPGTSAVAATLSVPTGIVVEALIALLATANTSFFYGLVTSLIHAAMNVRPMKSRAIGRREGAGARG